MGQLGLRAESTVIRDLNSRTSSNSLPIRYVNGYLQPRKDEEGTS